MCIDSLISQPFPVKTTNKYVVISSLLFYEDLVINKNKYVIISSLHGDEPFYDDVTDYSILWLR